MQVRTESINVLNNISLQVTECHAIDTDHAAQNIDWDNEDD
jgi:hypothetical protein